MIWSRGVVNDNSIWDEKGSEKLMIMMMMRYDKKDWLTEWNEWLKKIKNKIIVNIYRFFYFY